MTEQLIDKLKSGVQGETYTRSSHSVQVSYANSQFEDITNSRQQTKTLRVIKDGRIATAWSSRPNSDDQLLQNALSAVPFGSAVNYCWPGASPVAAIPLVDERVDQVELQTMLDLASDLTDSLLAFDPRIMVSAGVARYHEDVTLQNSSGFLGSFSRTGWSCGLGGQLVQGDDILWLGESESSSQFQTDYRSLKQNVIQQFTWAKTIVPFAAGSYPVIFAPSQVGFLTAPWLACLNGKAIVRDVSPWKDKLGRQLLDPRISLVDDGTLPHYPTSQPFDREGVPTKRNQLIDRGVVNQFVLDLQSAAELGYPSSGNGTTAGPSTHHVLLSPGEQSWRDLVSGLDRGLLVLGTMGAWTGNPYSGNVSGTISLGLLVERGQIIGRVKDCMFSLNSFTHFRDHLQHLSSDVMQQGSASYPYVQLGEVLIATK